MPYLIDGHNLIASLPDIDLADPHDEAKLVTKLKGFIAKNRRRQKCTVIFDGGLPGGHSTMSTKSIEVLFAATRHNDADTLLKLRIRRAKDPRSWTVVSSDQAILDCARTHKMRWLTSQEFADKLQSQPPEEESPGEEINPRPPSSQEIDEWLDLFGDH